MATDPICGIGLDERHGGAASYEGRSDYCCCVRCKSTFGKIRSSTANSGRGCQAATGSALLLFDARGDIKSRALTEIEE